MRERPILFNGAMVRAILEGRKTQTRRIVKLPHRNPLGEWQATTVGGPHGGTDARGDTRPEQAAIWHTRTGETLGCPIAEPGDRLYVRETWADANSEEGPCLLYRANFDRRYLDREGLTTEQFPRLDFAQWAADVEGEIEGGWRPSIHMPRAASRIDLAVTGVRVERLQDISEHDAEFEGSHDYWGKRSPWVGVCAPSIVHGFASLWEAVNGPGSWAANPWVWVVEFKGV